MADPASPSKARRRRSRDRAPHPKSRSGATHRASPHGPRCRCGGPMVPQYGAVPFEQALGPIMGPRVMAIIADDPPAAGELVELSPDRTRVTWKGATGMRHELEIIYPSAELDDDGEEDDTGWENETDDERVA